MALSITLALALCALPAPAGAVADTAASTGPASAVSATTAILNGTADAPDTSATYSFEYGTSPKLGQHTNVTAVGAGPTPAGAQLTGLTPGTTYYFRLVLTPSSYGNTYAPGETLRFTTTPIGSATATTSDATSVTASSAMLNGAANPDYSAQWAFGYGPTANYGQVTKLFPIPGGNLSLVSIEVGQLIPGTTYHYRLGVIENAGGHPIFAFGADRTFRTAGTAPRQYGTANLISPRLSVSRGGYVAMRFTCAGSEAAVCIGTIAVSARTHARPADCGGGVFMAYGGHSGVIRAKVGHACGALLARSGSHPLQASLSAKWLTHQAPQHRPVTLTRQHG